MLPWLRMELFESARHQRYTAGRFVGSATYSRIAGMTFPSIRIQSPSDGSIHSRSHSVVAEARNTKVPASQAGQVMPRQPKIWFSVSSARSVLQSVYLTQQSPNVPCTFVVLLLLIPRSKHPLICQCQQARETPSCPNPLVDHVAAADRRCDRPYGSRSTSCVHNHGPR